MNSYQYKQSNKQAKLLELHPQWFNNDKGGGMYRGNSYPFILTNPINNLFEGFRDNALSYVKENCIKWHSQWGNMKSSQVACFNHLFGIRNCQELILEMLNTAQNLTTFQRVLPIPYEADETYIAFEVVSKGGDWLGEGSSTRGANCTSIDAFILAEDFEAKRWLIPIEWKYTEPYARKDKSIEGKGQEGFEGSYKGKTRLNLYSHLIEQSKLLHSVQEYEGSIYYQEPFYKLMRQTLWAEQIMNKSICEEELSAQRMMHFYIVPEENIFILPSQYRKESISAHWQKQLKHPELFICISPKRFMHSILSKLNGNLGEYLQRRYWD